MYVPPNFAEDQVPVLHEAIREIKLGTLVTLGGEELIASHVPMLVDPEPAPYGVLRGQVVPTWNYAAIHAYGRVRFFDDAERLLALVTRLTDTHEAPLAQPWAVSDAPADFIRGMLRAIVGFELPIQRLEGKWKMSQNRPTVDRAGVVEGLRREGEPAVAEIVVERNRS